MYGAQLWNYSDTSNESFYVAWRRVLRRMWNLPNRTHNNLLPYMFDTKPIEIVLESRCLKYIYKCINSSNSTVRLISLSALNNRRSVLGVNFRYLAFKYKIDRSMWYSSLKCVMDKIEIYINLQFSNNIDVWEIGGMIRELILNRPYENHILNYEERKMMIDYLCTM